jgi:hypothetical protein
MTDFYRELCDRFFEFVMKLGSFMGLMRVSVAVEICPNSEMHGRVHLHAYLSGNECVRLDKFMKVMEFEGHKVAHKVFLDARGKRQVARAQNEAHYYLQFAKVGSVMRKSNYEKYKDFVVKKNWILNMFRQRKMSMTVATQEVIGARDCVRSTVLELKAIQEIHRDEGIMQECDRVLDELGQCFKPFKPASPAIREWMQQYDPYMQCNTAVHSRFKPLILDGPTRFGKTTWAKTFYGPKRTLVLQCQDMLQPCLREYVADKDRYSCILFDEADWRMIYHNKVLFQAGAHPVQLGQSPTNQYVYSCFVYSTPMIICSNGFYADIHDDAREYLDANVIYQRVTEPCWCE